MSALPIIIWDVDDVLNRLMYCWLDNWDKNAVRKFHYKDIVENPPHKLLGITENQYFSNLDEYRNSDLGRNVSINKCVFQWFQLYGNDFKHIACTARPVHTMPNQSWWIYTFFGRWIQTVQIASSLRDDADESDAQTKGQFVAWLNKEVVFIDDSERNVEEVSKIGGVSLLFPQPWNRNNQTEEEFIEDLNQMLGL